MVQPGTSTESVTYEARAAMAASLRSHISEAVKGQWQLLQLAAIAAGVAASLGWSELEDRPDALALISLLFMGFSIAILRLDQEIAVVASYLIDQSEFGEHARAQAAWERHKLKEMQGSGLFAMIASSTQTAGIYGIPLMAAVAAAVAAIRSDPTVITWSLLAVFLALVVLFVIGAFDVVQRYRRLESSANS